jgi:PAS domain S-box-containing protein
VPQVLAQAPIHPSSGRNGEEVQLEHRLMLLESAERVANLGSWEWFPPSGDLFWSDNLYRIFGIQPDELTLTSELILPRVHPDDRALVERYLETARRGVRAPAIQYRITRPGQEVRHLRSTVTMIESGGKEPQRITGVVQDVTDQLAATQALAAHAAVAAVLAEWESFEESGRRLLSGLGEALQFVFGALWLPKGDMLKARLDWSDSSLDSSVFEAATRGVSFPRGIGLLGRVWERKTPINVIDVRAEPNYRRRRAAADAGLQGATAFPVMHAGEVIAVLEFYKREEHRPGTGVSETMIVIADELGRFLSRRRGQLLDTSPLTPRERQVLQLAADGFSTSRIAACLNISAATIATHIKHIFESLGVRDRASAVAMAIRLGLIE